MTIFVARRRIGPDRSAIRQGGGGFRLAAMQSSEYSGIIQWVTTKIIGRTVTVLLGPCLQQMRRCRPISPRRERSLTVCNHSDWENQPGIERSRSTNRRLKAVGVDRYTVEANIVLWRGPATS
jgi:hypothetical protein